MTKEQQKLESGGITEQQNLRAAGLKNIRIKEQQSLRAA
jgi:hypothetical protein